MKLGTKVMTRGIAARIENDDMFSKSVADAIKKFQNDDWGNLSDDDKKVNEDALENGGLIMGVYGDGENRIWIMRDQDGKGSFVTTILFPDEY